MTTPELPDERTAEAVLSGRGSVPDDWDAVAGFADEVRAFADAEEVVPSPALAEVLAAGLDPGAAPARSAWARTRAAVASSLAGLGLVAKLGLGAAVAAGGFAGAVATGIVGDGVLEPEIGPVLDDVEQPTPRPSPSPTSEPSPDPTPSTSEPAVDETRPVEESGTTEVGGSTDPASPSPTDDPSDDAADDEDETADDEDDADEDDSDTDDADEDDDAGGCAFGQETAEQASGRELPNDCDEDESGDSDDDGGGDDVDSVDDAPDDADDDDDAEEVPDDDDDEDDGPGSSNGRGGSGEGRDD